jgi:hypothetical protein
MSCFTFLTCQKCTDNHEKAHHFNAPIQPAIGDKAVIAVFTLIAISTLSAQFELGFL